MYAHSVRTIKDCNFGSQRVGSLVASLQMAYPNLSGLCDKLETYKLSWKRHGSVIVDLKVEIDGCSSPLQVQRDCEIARRCCPAGVTLNTVIAMESYDAAAYKLSSLAAALPATNAKVWWCAIQDLDPDMLRQWSEMPLTPAACTEYPASLYVGVLSDAAPAPFDRNPQLIQLIASAYHRWGSFWIEEESDNEMALFELLSLSLEHKHHVRQYRSFSLDCDWPSINCQDKLARLIGPDFKEEARSGPLPPATCTDLQFFCRYHRSADLDIRDLSLQTLTDSAWLRSVADVLARLTLDRFFVTIAVTPVPGYDRNDEAVTLGLGQLGTKLTYLLRQHLNRSIMASRPSRSPGWSRSLQGAAEVADPPA